MALKFDFGGTDLEIVRSFRTKNAKLISDLEAKMLYDLNLLKAKAQELAPVGPSIPEQDHVSGTLRESFQDPTVTVEGSKIIGELKWGGAATTVSYKGGKAYDYARILNEGSSAHAVNPLEEEGSRFPAEKTLTGHSYRRSGKGVLFFLMGGKEVFAEYAFPSGVTPNLFVEDALDQMRDQFITDLQSTITSKARE